jgi:hypothetical protein
LGDYFIFVLFPLLEEHASPMAGYARERGDFENPA